MSEWWWVRLGLANIYICVHFFVYICVQIAEQCLGPLVHLEWGWSINFYMWEIRTFVEGFTTIPVLHMTPLEN